MDPDTLATVGTELLYENAPALLDVGGVNVKESPGTYVRDAILKLPMAGVALLMVNVAVLVPDV